eukprot:TRINITY_DN4966_c0_g1_i1.p1 TRINITY_DN4966_c0_g1~~TRINITY_DN4966_c0_g1_i1.p1  ORF type:complete len:271 (+),score=25.65 TRINITY_DN4966_c0_g1_i1:164-976(+)
MCIRDSINAEYGERSLDNMEAAAPEEPVPKADPEPEIEVVLEEHAAGDDACLMQADDRFGREIYRFMDTTHHHCGTLTTETCLNFYEDVVTYEARSQLLCYPGFYYKTVVPRYRIVGVTISQDMSVTRVRLSSFMITVGIILTAALATSSPGAAAAFAILLIGGGLVQLIIPLCATRKYTTHLQLLKGKYSWTETIRNLVSSIFGGEYTLDTMVVKTTTEPDHNQLQQYVFGSVCDHSKAKDFHICSHLMNDNLVEKVDASRNLQYLMTK